MDGDEVNWNVAPFLLGCHVPQVVEVAVYVVDVHCELEEAAAAVRVVDWHKDAVDEAAREMLRIEEPAEFQLGPHEIHFYRSSVSSAGCRNEQEDVLELQKVENQGRLVDELALDRELPLLLLEELLGETWRRRELQDVKRGQYRNRRLPNRRLPLGLTR